MNTRNPMHNSNQFKLKYLQSLIFRVPTFSLNALAENIRKIELGQSTDRLQLESLFLASPSLFKEIEQKPGKDDTLNLHISILKYYIRMCTRCTPFGLFAGCGIGEAGSNSQFELSHLEQSKSCTRLDMNYLCAFIQNIVQLNLIKVQLKFYPNTSLYSSGKDLRYTEYSLFKTHRKYSLSEVEQSEYLAKVLQKAGDGATIDDLANLLEDDDITIEEAREYIDELIENQILLSELEPSVTGNDLLNQFIVKLEKLNGVNEIINSLKKIQLLLQTIDNTPLGRPVEMYSRVKKELNTFTISPDERYLFQSDLLIESEKAILGKPVVDAACKAIKVLNRLTSSYDNPLLKKFREDFYKKYENEEIPLILALDVETGVGFGSIDGQRGDIAPLLENVFFARQHPTDQDINISPVHMMLNKKYDGYLKDSFSNEVHLTDQDLEPFSENWNDLPDTISAMIEVIHTEECPNGLLISMKNAGGSSAANLLARFSYLNEKIHDHVRQIVKKEKELNTDMILAEIVHLPESRIGNILMRPVLRDYEIPYLANPSVEKGKVIPITDLMVSVVQGRYIKLRSKRLGKEVLPRLSSAHNFSINSLPIYHFLCTLQTQGLRGGVSFNWGPILKSKPFLPRVRYKNIIFSPAIWNITTEDIKPIPKITDKHFLGKVLDFKKKRNIPDKVLLVQGDNKLLIDFNHELSVQMLFSEVKKNPFKLEEFLFDGQYSLVKRGKEVFTNQVILSFYKDKQQTNEHV